MPASEIQRWIPVLQELWLTAACTVLAEYAGGVFEADDARVMEAFRPLEVCSEFELRIDQDSAGKIIFGVPAGSVELSEFVALGQAGQSVNTLWDSLSAKTVEQWLELVRSETSLVCTVKPVRSDPAAYERTEAAARFSSSLKSEKLVLPVCLVVAFEEDNRAAEAVPDRTVDARAQKAYVDLAAGDSSSANLDLLLDIELQASLRFGGREMLLSEILDMAPGDVVSLDRPVHAPVDLVVGDRIVARGEVVLVDGNYGLRVTEVAEPRKRLETVRCLF
ncbi:MAG TPA: FliM/FliN family flagellar motor switch protein [Granulicella sp.]|jgi:flagellar motor switch protein FliN|nr:FliM/FliN family flagellar motor switch protein [Granulicella sp.]